jgi:hypothetical protein
MAGLEDLAAKAISERIEEKRYPHSSYSWEGECNSLYDRVKSFKSLKELIQNGDINTKILAMQYIAPWVIDLLSENERGELSGILRSQLSDGRMCIISYSAPQSDEEDTRTVAGAARFALHELEAYKPGGY